MISKLKAVLDDDRGVSPVIGVILMVAITVILAAVIGTFVLGLGDSLEQAPQAQLDVSSNSAHTITISHNGGDAIPKSDLTINVESNDETTNFIDNANEDFSVGGSLDYDSSTESPEYSNEVTVTVIHEPSQSILMDTTVEVQT